MDRPPGTLWVVSVGDHRWAAPVGVVDGLVTGCHWPRGQDPHSGLTWSRMVDARQVLEVAPRVPRQGVGLLWRGPDGHRLVIVDALEYLWTPPNPSVTDATWRAVAPEAWHPWIAAAYRLGPRWVWRWREDWLEGPTGIIQYIRHLNHLG